LKKRLNILFLSLLLLVAGTFSVSAQIVDAEGQYVDTVFNDHVDRTAEDFVMVSLMISQPSDVRVYSIFGHAALRLQCPTFDLDYVFSYISIHSDAAALDYIVIRPTMGLIVVPTQEYVEEEFRGVREYKMYLPPKVETELWRILDENTAKGYERPYDCVAGSCAQMVYQYIMSAIAAADMKDSVSTRWLGEPEHTMHELMNIYAKDAPWQLCLINSLLGSSYVDNVQMSNDRKILFPEQLLALWHNTTFCGKPILSEEAEVHTTSEIMTAPMVTPFRIAMVLLLLALCSFATLFCGKIVWIKEFGNGIDYSLLGLQTLAGIFMMVMMWIAYLPFPQAHWNWLLVPFNILPAICWKWRMYWALPYAIVLAIWCVVMLFVPHMLVDATHIVLTAAFASVLLKQSNILQRLVTKSVA
jgi:hypothetical protein